MRAHNGTNSTLRRIEALHEELISASVESPAFWPRTDLTLTQLRALSLVELRGSLSVGALAAALQMSLASASALTERLVRGKHLKRRRDEEDRRRVLIELAPGGAVLLRQLREHSQSQMRRSLKAMRPSDQKAFAVALEAFVRVTKAAIRKPR